VPRVVPKRHPERPSGIPEGAWPAPAGGTGERPAPSGKTVERAYLIATRPIIVGGWYADVGTLLNPDDPAVARAAQKHPDWFAPATRTEVAQKP
jgi:hypothetical protein